MSFLVSVGKFAVQTILLYLSKWSHYNKLSLNRIKFCQYLGPSLGVCLLFSVVCTINFDLIRGDPEESPKLFVSNFSGLIPLEVVGKKIV